MQEISCPPDGIPQGSMPVAVCDPRLSIARFRRKNSRLDYRAACAVCGSISASTRSSPICLRLKLPKTHPGPLAVLHDEDDAGDLAAALVTLLGGEGCIGLAFDEHTCGQQESLAVLRISDCAPEA